MRFRAMLAMLAVVIAACGAAPVVADPPRSAGIPVAVAPEPADQKPSIIVEPIEATTLGAYATASLGVTVVARVRAATGVYAARDDETPQMTLPAATVLGTATVVNVIQATEDGWLEVLLPVRPNGSTGWVRRSDVTLFVVDGELVVDLSEHRLSYTVDGEELFSGEVAVGSPANPTPTGRFYVTDRVTIQEAAGPWGPHALGLSARSNTITEFNGGNGIIGIHGTNSPSSIGHDASLGCVRLSNDMITELFPMVRVGTPVEIRA